MTEQRQPIYNYNLDVGEFKHCFHDILGFRLDFENYPSELDNSTRTTLKWYLPQCKTSLRSFIIDDCQSTQNMLSCKGCFLKDSRIERMSDPIYCAYLKSITIMIKKGTYGTWFDYYHTKIYDE